MKDNVDLAVDQLAHLGLGRRHHPGMAMPRVRHPNAGGEVEDFAAVGRIDPRSGRVIDHEIGHVRPHGGQVLHLGRLRVSH